VPRGGGAPIRATLQGDWVHTDVGLQTLQVALNDGYTGGRLLFCTPRGVFLAAARLAGTATIHRGTVARGVTAHTAGVPYGLFLLKALPEVPSVGLRSPAAVAAAVASADAYRQAN
jgi:hypothetical protein